MTGDARPTPPDAIRPRDMLISCVVLFALAIAQPLLDLLGRNAEFFLARAAPALDIVALGLLLGIAIPLLIGVVVAGVGMLNLPVGRALHMAVLTILGGFLVLQITSRTPLEALPAWLEIALALAGGAAITWGFYRSETLRSIFRFGAVAPLVIVGLFLFTSSASQLVFAAPAIAQPAAVAVADPAPVVMIVFDEFPAASLMDAEGNVEEAVYPNFARLARDGTWFANTTTVQQQTEKAMPAILTGNDPGDRDALPTASDYPANLFTLLAETYDLEVREAVTELCPEYACENTSRPTLPFGERWRSLGDDIRVVAGHVFLPDDLGDDLPPINQTWSNFAEATEREEFDIIARFQELEAADRRVPVNDFLAGIEPPGDEPQLDFVHALLPHVPWSYLQSGQTYPSPSPAPGSESPGWGSDEWLVDQAYQQHLVQVMYVDTIIGDVIARLEQTGQYDDALIVVLADHGISVRPDIPHRRVAYDYTIGDIAAVPLFIKRPNDPGAGRDDYPAMTVDVLPTITDVLGIDLPWETEGISLFAEDRPERTESRISGSEGTITFPADGAAARAIASRKIAHFGDDGPYGLAPPGHADLLGADVDVLEVGGTSAITATLRNPAELAAVDLDGPFLPARVRGSLSSGDDDVVVAVAVNGDIVAVTRSLVTESGTTEFGALIPPDTFVDGANRVELFEVVGTAPDRTLQAIAW